MMSLMGCWEAAVKLGGLLPATELELGSCEADGISFAVMVDSSVAQVHQIWSMVTQSTRINCRLGSVLGVLN